MYPFIFLINESVIQLQPTFCTVSFQYWVNCLWDLFVSFFLVHRFLWAQFLYDIRASTGQGISPSRYFMLDQNNLCKKTQNKSSSAPEAENLPHNSWAKKLLIKLAWLIRPGVMKNWKLQAVRASCTLFYVFAVFSKFFTAFATGSSWPLLWIYSLLSITTNCRRAWTFNCTPKDSTESQWTYK